MPRLKASPLDALLYVTGLALACSLAWLGYMALNTPDVRAGIGLDRARVATGPAGMIWFAPAAYLAAWQVLVFRTWAIATVGLILVAALVGATFWATWLTGLISFGLLVPFAPIPCIWLIGFVLAGVQGADRNAATGVVHWGSLHGAGGTAAFIASFFVIRYVGTPWTDPSWSSVVAFVGGILCAFAPHATMSWIELRKGGQPKVKPSRVLTLVAAAWALPAAMLAAETRSWSEVAWPAKVVSLMQARKADLELFGSIGVRAPGFHAGETLAVFIDGREFQASVPAGWLVTNPRYPESEGLRPMISFAPDPRAERQASSPSTKVNIGGQPALIAARPVEARPDLKRPGDWREFGCAAGDPSFGALVVCRLTEFGKGDDRPHPPLVARFPDANLQHRAILDRRGFGVGRVYFLAGPSVWATCELGRDCHFWFPAGERSAVKVTMPEAEVHRWREARAEADAVARAAVSFGLSSRPTLKQPDGEVLPLAFR